MQLKDIIYNIYGRDITANLLEVNRRSLYYGDLRLHWKTPHLQRESGL